MTVEVGDESHDVACSGRRVRWGDVARTVRELADGEAARVVLRGADGATIGVFRLEADDGAAPDAPAAAPMDARDERVLTLLVSAQRAALDEQRQLLAPVLESYTALARGYAEYAAQVVELVRLARQLEEDRTASTPADAALVELAGRVVGAPSTAKPRPNGAA